MDLNTLRDKWDELPTAQKQKITKVGIGMALVLLCLVAYSFRGEKKPIRTVTEEKRELDIGKDMLEDDIRSTVNNAVDNWKDSDKDKEKRLQALELIATQLAKGPADDADKVDPVVGALDSHPESAVPTGKPAYPQPPSYPQQASVGASSMGAGPITPMEPPKPIEVGAIGHVAGTQTDKALDSKKKHTVYLPPSFMDGMVLTGIEADAGENAKAEPEPIIIRVEAPAQLPNELKANLKGCFVVANATGKLNKERVEARLVSLNCMLTNGDAVIDQQVKGMVVDADGKKGLAGIVVSKAGTLVARSVLAGAFGGLAESVAISNTTTSISPIGTTQTFDGDKALQSGLSKGLSAGATEIQKIYIDLIKQTTPVIEIGAAKKCTVVITEGVQLEIKTTRAQS